MNMITRLLLFFLLSTAGLFAAAAQKAEADGPLVKGRVTRILEERKLVMVKHEEIPGVMKAMTMAFAVPEAVYPKLKSGTYLTGTLEGGRGEWRLTDVRITDRHYVPLPPEKETEEDKGVETEP